MAQSKFKREPGFFWQGVLILLPVGVFAVIGLVLLQKDKAMVEKEARDNAASLGQQLAGFIGPKLWGQMLWRSGKVLSVDWNSAANQILEPSIWLDDKKRQFKVPMEPYRRLFSTTAHPLGLPVDPEAQLIVGKTGKLLSPAPYPDSPTPIVNPLAGLDAAQRQLLQSARSSPEAVAEANWKRWFETSPPPDVRARTQMEFALFLAREGRKTEAKSIFVAISTNELELETETGLPLQPLASLQALRLTDAKDNEGLFTAARQLAEKTVRWPSILSPRLMEEASRNLPAGSSASKKWAADTNSPLAQWDVMEEARELHVYLFESGNDGTRALRTNAFWTRWNGQDYFVVPSPQFVPPHWQEAGMGLRVLSKELIELSLLELLAQSDSQLPAYATVQFNIADRILPESADATVLAETPITGWRHEPQATKFFTGMQPVPNISLLVCLGKPEALFALQRERALFFGGLIAACATAALIGFFAARRAFYRQLRLNEMKSNFVSSVSHELRAPIASVRLMAEGLERGKIAGAEKQNEYFKFIVQECRRLSSLIENVLDFSRIEQGRKQYEMEATDLVALTNQTVKLMETYAAERQVKIALAVKGDAVPVEIEGKSIQQALVNLIDNAVKHSPKGSAIKVGVDFPSFAPTGGEGARRADDGERFRGIVQLWVEDKGEGIPAPEHERIFERFYRLGSELRRETQGVGIGLSIVKHIVEAHGGKIIVHSAPREGSRFTIELPITQKKGET